MGVKIVLKYIPNEDFLSFELPTKEYLYKVNQLLKNCEDNAGGYVSINLDRPYKPRTTGEGSQNNLFWLLCTKIANEVGDDSEGMRDTEQGIKMRALSRGYPFKVSKITGEKIPASMTTVNTVEQSYLIDTAYEICSELGIVLEPELVRQEQDMNEVEMEELYKNGLF